MVELRPVPFLVIQKHFVDFQQKSKCFEMPPEKAEFLGIYQHNEMIGYFIVIGYDFTIVEVNQGYLLPKFRHKSLPWKCMQALEELSKAAGYKVIKLCTQNRFRSYLKFMERMKYKPERLIFSKEVN